MMSPQAIPCEELKIEAEESVPGLSRFGRKTDKHYFCKTAGSVFSTRLPERPATAGAIRGALMVWISLLSRPEGRCSYAIAL